MMKNRRIASLMILTILITTLYTQVMPEYVGASTRLTVGEGSGKGPEVEVVRVDDEGNEIIVDEDTPSDDTEEVSDNPSAVTYENDMSGAFYTAPQSDMTTVYVSTAEDMENLARNCRLDTWSRDKNVVLKNDILLDGSNFKYIPIFSGIFDGQGHTISGVTISDAESYTGLFCITQETAIIKNLKVQGSLIPAGQQLATGGIVGDNYGMISNCIFEGNIDGYDYTGGIAGYNEQSGIITSCKSSGYIMGMHFTGGITGYNLGMISGCTNDAKINMTSVDETVSIKDINIDQYADKLRNLLGDNYKQDSTNILVSTVDAGGICGYSQGQILSCVNNSLVGYEHVGYNIGGIVGRQNGYVNLCINNGDIYGRKDVGGIVGQAEPYVVIDITKDIIGQLTSNMNTLHDLVGTTLNDAGSESNLITARLNMVKSFTDKALGDTSYLANETEDWINGVVGSGNEIFNRIEYAMSESVKSGGVFDQTRNATVDAYNAAANLTKAVDDLNIYKYMNEEEKVSYNQAKEDIDTANRRHQEISESNNKNYDYYYCKLIKDQKSASSNLVLLNENDEEIGWDALSKNGESYKVKHKDDSTDPPTYTDFPAAGDDYEKNIHDAATVYAKGEVINDTDNDFRAEFGKSYPEYLAENVEIISRIVASHEQEMTDNTRRDVKYAVDYTKRSLNDLGNAVGETKRIVSNISSKSDIRMPGLSDEYKARSNSLIANIQGMSDNLGFLNNEMNASNQQLVDDMVKVNDQFNVIMLLIADAIDGVLDVDYTDIYTDNSLSVAETSSDATIADSINYGGIHGDIDTGGVAGTMAIEYDFDLESDITGINEAAKGVTYKTKCVLRRNKNDGYVNGLKSYVGGICGRQEMGTVLHCQNYGRLKSDSGDYIGGISGESLSTIHNCYTKGIMTGDSYIGGIAGKGYDIKGCYSLPTIENTGGYIGAIAGDNDPDGRVFSNYFVSDEYAGINRVSYSGKAEPVSYNGLLETEDIPSEFNTIKVRFILDDEVYSIQDYNYGEYIKTLPSEINEAEYIKWDWDAAKLNDLKSDTEVIGHTAKYNTTLAGLQLRESGQSAVLVDGKFVDGQVLSTRLSGENSASGIVETWQITIPDDFSDEHLIRYCPPSSVKEFKIWIEDTSGRREAELTPMGKYSTFTVSGSEVVLLIEDTYENPLIKYAVYEIAGLIALLVLIGIIMHNKKKKRASAKASDPDDDIIDIDLDKADE